VQKRRPHRTDETVPAWSVGFHRQSLHDSWMTLDPSASRALHKWVRIQPLREYTEPHTPSRSSARLFVRRQEECTPPSRSRRNRKLLCGWSTGMTTTEIRRQIPPRRPSPEPPRDPFENQPMIGEPTTSLAHIRRHQRRGNSPELIRYHSHMRHETDRHCQHPTSMGDTP